MKKFDVVESWLDNVAYSHKQNINTPLTYKIGLSRFCEFIDSSPEEILKQYEETDEKEFKRKYAAYLKAFISNQSRQGLTSNTIDSRVSSVRSFFKYNDLSLGFVPKGKCAVVYHNRDITKEEVVEILKVSKPRDKAFFCMMAQSGLRPETLCELQIKYVQPDLDKGTVPALIEVPSEITKGAYGKYITFMGEESVKYLKNYLMTRKKTSPDDLLFMSHGEEKPLSSKSISTIFKKTIVQLKTKGILDFEQKVKGKPRNVRLYNLRKFFRKYAAQAGYENFQYWMGHVIAGVDASYRPQDPEFYRQVYAEKALPYLRLETATPSETDKALLELEKKHAEEIQSRDKSIEEMKNRVSKTESENSDLKRRIMKTEEKLGEIETILKKMVEDSSENDSEST